MIMMGSKRKGIIDTILGDPEDKPEGAPEMDALSTIAQELITAVKEEDADAVVSAFKAMFAQCESEPHSEYDEEV